MRPNTPLPPNQRTSFHSRQRLQASQRRLECVELRLEGKTIREIGKLLDLSASTVQGHIKTALAVSQSAAAHAAIKLRSQEHRRIEELLLHWGPLAHAVTGSWASARATKIVLMAQQNLLLLYAAPAGETAPVPESHAAPRDSDNEPLTPEEDAFLDRVALDPVLSGAQAGLLPNTGYDDAWDALDAWRGAGGPWQPAEYQPDDKMQEYLRTNWHAWFPRTG